MNKNYKAAVDEQVNEYCQKYGLYGDSIVDFKAGADFASNYQQAKIDKLVLALNVATKELKGTRLEIAREALADYEKDGE